MKLIVEYIVQNENSCYHPYMGVTSKEIRITYVDPELDNMIRSLGKNGNSESYTRCFNYNEEFFLKFESALDIPHFPIHHDVRKPRPEEAYMEDLRSVFKGIARCAPSLFQGLTYIFNPYDVFTPAFYSVYRIEERQYLYLLHFNLLFKPQYCDIVEQGTNDIAPSFTTRHLFVDATFIPLERVQTKENKVVGFEILQTISETWIGERGRGYFVQGIWIDDALTNFFSRLFLPAGKTVYPFFPFLCKYKTVCGNIIWFKPEQREKELPFLHNAVLFLEPEMRNIEAELKHHDFSPDLQIFGELKKRIPDFFRDYHKGINMSPYLNENNMKEYAIVEEH